MNEQKLQKLKRVKLLLLICLPRIEVFLLFNASLKLQFLQNKTKKVKRKTTRYKKEENFLKSEERRY